MTKMAFEINDLKGILILILFAIPTIASTNINCSGRAFHCVNSTHFMICVDLGGGLSTTIDDFIIPCPATTVCHQNNIFECDFPEVVTPPPLQVISVYKQSEKSELTTVTNSVTPTSDIFSVFKENVIAPTLSIPEEVTPVVKLEVLEGITDLAGVNNENGTETSFKVTSSFKDSGNEIVKDKQASNKTITTSVTDNNKNLEPTVENLMNKTVNTSSTDNSTSIDMVTTVIGLINLISTGPSSVASKKPSFDALTPLDSFYDNIATTTEQYITKEVKIHGEKINHVTDTINIPTEIIFTESSVVSTTSVANIYNKNNTIEYVNITESIYQKNAEKNNSTLELVPETTTASVQIVTILEPVTVGTSLKTTTDDMFRAPLGLVDYISANSVPSTNGYINTFNTNAATTTTDKYTTKLEKTVIEKPVTTEVISTNPIINAVVRNVSETKVNNTAFTEFNSTGEIKQVPDININYSSSIAKLMTIPNLQTSTEKTFIPITGEANFMNTTKTVAKSEVLFNNDSPADNQTIVTQPLDKVIGTESPIVITDNLYQINEELNLTLITTKHTIIDTLSTNEKDSTVLNVSKSTEPTLTSPTGTKYPAIEITTTETLLTAFSPSALEVTSEVNISSSVNEPYLENVKHKTLSYKTINTINTTENDKTVLNAPSTDINNSKHTEPTLSTLSTIKYPTVETSTAETLQNDFTTQQTDTKNELLATNTTPSVNEPSLENVGANVILSVLTTPAAYYVTTEPVANTTDLKSQSDIATDPMNLPINLGTILYQGNMYTEKPIPDIVGQTTTYWSTVEKSISTPVPSAVTENTNLSHIVKPFNQDNISATDDIKIQDVLKPKPDAATRTVSYLPKIAITTHKTVHTTPISIDSTLIFEQVSTYTPEVVDVYRASTSDNKIKTSSIFQVDVTRTSYAEYATDIPITALPPQESTSQKISTVKQLNTTSLPSDLVYTTFATAVYDVNNTTDLNTSNQINSVNTDTVSSKVDLNADVNTTETVNPGENKNNESATLSAINNKDENIKIMSVLDIVNSSEKVMPTETMQQSSTNSSLSNDYIKTIMSGAYVTETDNVPGYTLVQVAESVSQKNPETTVPLAETKIINSVSSTLTTLPIIEIRTEKVKYVGTEAPIPSTIDFKYTDPTKTVVDDVTEKTNDYVSTDAMISQVNKLPIVLAETSPSSVKSVTTGTGSIIVPVYDEVTTMKDSAFIMSSTVATDSNIKTRTESPLLTSTVREPEIVKYNQESSLLTLEVPVTQMTTEPTHTNKMFSQTTPLAVTGETNQDGLTEINTTDLSQSVFPTINHNEYQPMPSLPTVEHTTALIHTANIVAQTASVAAVSKTNPDVLTEIKASKPQNVLSTVNRNIPLSTSTLSIARVIDEQITTTEPIHTINTFAQTTPLALTGTTNQEILPKIKATDLPLLSMLSLATVRATAAQITTETDHKTNTLYQTTPLPATGTGIITADVPQFVTTVKNNSPQPMPSLAIAKVTASQITTEPAFTITTLYLTSAGKTKQDVQSELKTTDLLQYATSTVASNNPQFVSDTTTETITDSLTAPDSMVETINVTGDKISETHVRETISSDVMFNNLTDNNVNNSAKTVKNIIDHESIVIGIASKTVKSVDMNKAEIVNHTESNLIGSDVNIDNVKIKESGKDEEGNEEKEDSKSSATKTGTDVQNKNMPSDSSIITKIKPKDGTPVEKIEYMVTTITTNHSGSESGGPNNGTQLKPIITIENNKSEIDSSVNANIEIIDVTKHPVLVYSKNISNSYNKNNTHSNITTSLHNLSQPNSTINDELEQHLKSTNHTITTEVQSHLNESDKQGNKTNDEVPLSVASMNNPNLTNIKLNASSNDTSAITVPASVFNCTNTTRGKYSDKEDCRKFYTCIGNLRPTLGTCPNNTVFSEINKQCTRNLSHCVRNNQFRCLFEGRFSDFFRDNIYYICVKNRLHGFIRYKLQCQADYHLNKDSVKCEKNEEISIQSASSVSETNDEIKPKPKSEKIVSTDDFECEKEGKFPYAKDCSKYYVCTKVKNVYRRKIKKCVSDEVFDKSKKDCVESDSGEC